MDGVFQPFEGEAGTGQAVDRQAAVEQGRRSSTSAERSSRARYEARRAEVRTICRQHIAARNLPARFVDVDFDPTGRAATIYLWSEVTADFRELSRDLYRDLRMKVRMHRLGPRDEAKRTGTCGPCGRTLCCKTFLSGFSLRLREAGQGAEVPADGGPLSRDVWAPEVLPRLRGGERHL